MQRGEFERRQACVTGLHCYRNTTCPDEISLYYCLRKVFEEVSATLRCPALISIDDREIHVACPTPLIRKGGSFDNKSKQQSSQVKLSCFVVKSWNETCDCY